MMGHDDALDDARIILNAGVLNLKSIDISLIVEVSLLCNCRLR
jgi:hypothetical protein